MDSNTNSNSETEAAKIKGILTASEKRGKNRRISWGDFNKAHFFTLDEGHLYDMGNFPSILSKL